MPKQKRKAQAQTQSESSEHTPPPHGSIYNNNNNNNNNRRIVTASARYGNNNMSNNNANDDIGSLASEGGGGAAFLSPSTVGTETGSTPNRVRKKERGKTFIRDMMHLNYSFAKWAHETEGYLLESIESKGLSGQSSTSHPSSGKIIENLQEAITSYIQRSEQITLQYQPPNLETLMFGSGDAGQLALSDAVFSSQYPRAVSGLHEQKVVSLACGGLHSAAVLDTGSVQVWGCNDHGSLGKFILDTAWAPTGISGFIPSSKGFKLNDTDDEAVTFWNDLSKEQRLILEKEPDKVPQDREEKIVEVAAGDCQTLMLSSTGRVYFTGCYKCMNGKFWRNARPPDDPRIVHPKKGSAKKDPPFDSQDWPIHVYQIPGKAEKISCGASINAAIIVMEDANGDTNNPPKKTCVTWGVGELGELARPVFNPIKDPEEGFYNSEEVKDEHLVPKPVSWPDSHLSNTRSVEEIACGAYHLLVIARDYCSGKGGDLVAFSSGLNSYGQLGLGDKKDRKILTRISHFDGCNIVKVAGGNFHSLCLDSTKRNLYTMGRGDYGQLGITKEVPEAGYAVLTPKPVKLIQGQEINPVISKIACGDNHCIVLTEGNKTGSSGDLYTWGYGDGCALGHPGGKDECMPRKLDPMIGINRKRQKKDPAAIPLNAEVKLIAGGGQHTGITVVSSSMG